MTTWLSAGEHAGSGAVLAEVAINRDAGRGGLLIVPVRLENGDEYPFVIDTGATGSMIDLSLAPRLGKPIATAIYQSWGVTKTNNAYAPPRMFLGGYPLVSSGPAIAAYDCKNQFPNLRPRIMGLLGMDVLQHYCIQLNFKARTMRLLRDGADSREWGKAFPMMPLNTRDPRPAIAENLLGLHGPRSLIDIGCSYDGWLMPGHFQQWTNRSVAPGFGEARAPNGYFAGTRYPAILLDPKDVETDGIGLRFFARHLVTLDFPNRTLYLAPQTANPLAP
ncbi:MAG TPA: retropepsin-like aspartic protease [Verrucomicrobiae bacterium]